MKGVLLKGDPGIGKSSLCKQIAQDWAMCVSDTFVVVFLVSLKLVGPWDTIENSIIAQYPGLGIGAGKLKALLETFGEQCLLILDGLDEHALGYNEDVFHIIQKRKFPHCKIILTSRPHSAFRIEKFFETVVRVNGFTRQEAKKFATKVVIDQRIVENILRFSSHYDAAFQSQPILLSFLCLLVREEGCELLKDSVHIAELFIRMLRCLYKKILIRKNTEYDRTEFVKLMATVGKIAFQTLLSPNPLIRKSTVIHDVGPDAFDCGLLTGHEYATKLIPDETTDMFVTFPHRSFVEFLGALYFIQALSKGESLDNLIGGYAKPLFMMNPLFLNFCLWFLYHSTLYCNFQNVEKVCHIVQKFILGKIDTRLLSPPHIVIKYRAMNIEEIGDILSKCHNVRMLELESIDSLDWVLTSMKQALPLITYIAVKNCFVMNRIHNDLRFLVHDGLITRSTFESNTIF